MKKPIQDVTEDTIKRILKDIKNDILTMLDVENELQALYEFLQRYK